MLDACRQELFEYNISSNMWIQLPMRGTAPRARYRHTAVVCGDAMFTFGGVDKTQYRFPDLHERLELPRSRKASGNGRRWWVLRCFWHILDIFAIFIKSSPAFGT